MILIVGVITKGTSVIRETERPRFFFLRKAEVDTKESQAVGATAEVQENQEPVELTPTCLSPLVGSCLRRDTTEAARILNKSLSDEALIC